MNKKIVFLTTLLVFPLLISCNKEKSQKALMPPITGRAGEVTLVMPNELYEGSIGDSLFAVLCQEEKALPQSGMDGAEPMFDLAQIPPSAFGNVLRSNRNIIIVTIDAELEKPVIRIERDYWAKNQLLIRLGAPTKESLAQLIYDKDDFIVETIRQAEIDREIYLGKLYENTELINQLRRNHQMHIQFPKGWQPRKNTEDFLWVEHHPADITLGLLVSHYPYTSEDQVSYSSLITDTEAWLKKNVPGPSDGTYVAIELNTPVYSREFEKDSLYVRELKGLWRVENDFMGGPFISWTFVDEPRSRVVTVYGFVYAPKVNKRNQIRKVESLLHTVSFPAE